MCDLNGRELSLRTDEHGFCLFLIQFEYIFCHPVQYVVKTVGNGEEDVIYQKWCRHKVECRRHVSDAGDGVAR